MKILVAFVGPPSNKIAAYDVCVCESRRMRQSRSPESNHRWELPVVVEEEALLRRARGRHGHLVKLLGIWNIIHYNFPEICFHHFYKYTYCRLACSVIF